MTEKYFVHQVRLTKKNLDFVIRFSYFLTIGNSCDRHHLPKSSRHSPLQHWHALTAFTDDERHDGLQEEVERPPRVQNPGSRLRRRRRPPRPQVQVPAAHGSGGAGDVGAAPGGAEVGSPSEVGAERVGGVLPEAAGGVVAHVHPEVLKHPRKCCSRGCPKKKRGSCHKVLAAARMMHPFENSSLRKVYILSKKISKSCQRYHSKCSCQI